MEYSGRKDSFLERPASFIKWITGWPDMMIPYSMAYFSITLVLDLCESKENVIGRLFWAKWSRKPELFFFFFWLGSDTSSMAVLRLICSYHEITVGIDVAHMC